jgi:hypothetical protein
LSGTNIFTGFSYGQNDHLLAGHFQSITALVDSLSAIAWFADFAVGGEFTDCSTNFLNRLRLILAILYVQCFAMSSSLHFLKVL